MNEDEPTIISFAANRDRAEKDTRVRCPKCNELIPMRDIKCEYCGVNFNGEAWQFSPSSDHRSPHSRRMPFWLILGVSIVTIIYLIFFMRSW